MIDYAELCKFVAPLLLGGISGTLVTQYFTKRRAAREACVRIAEKYLDEFSNAAAAHAILEMETALQGPTEQNIVRRHADWWEIVLTFKTHKLLDAALFSSLDLETQRMKLRDAIRKDMNKEDSRFPMALKDWPLLMSN